MDQFSLDKYNGKTVDGWNSGLVIEDKDGNQFVWVPVDGTNVKYEKWYGDKNNGDITSAGGLTALSKTATGTEENKDELPEGITDEQAQIEKYHGFYIARYEAGIPEEMVEDLSPESATNDKAKMKEIRSVEGTPVSKKNQVPWNNIDYTQAKINAEKMYSNNNVQSCLLTGTMWDTTMAWLEKSEALTSDEINQDSSSWGNYRTAEIRGITEYSKWEGWHLTGVNWEKGNKTKPSGIAETADYMWLLKTGNTEYTKRNNIYDLAGNVWEWTTEKFVKTGEDSSYCVCRGGVYGDCGVDHPASSRDYCNESHNGSRIGFRVGLFIK